jgi:uncharacterized protein YdhG (YjbR/CyaY superfamily)
MTRLVDEYIAQFDGEVKVRLETMRRIIHETAPEAIESVSYGMPAYKLHSKPLVYFAGYKNHIGFYATPNGHDMFRKEFSRYKQGKGSVQFPLDEPLPCKLIKKVVLFRMQQLT